VTLTAKKKKRSLLWEALHRQKRENQSRTWNVGSRQGPKAFSHKKGMESRRLLLDGLRGRRSGLDGGGQTPH